MATEQFNSFAMTNDSLSNVSNANRIFTIGDLSREFQISLRSLRFYEDRGLLTPHRRGTARLFSATDRLRLQMILKGKDLGFTLSEIREMLNLDVKDGIIEPHLNLKPDQILSQIGHLERQRSDLDRAIDELRTAHNRLADPSRSAKISHATR